MNDTLDRWIQRVTLAALLALTAALLTVGALLYASPSRAGPSGISGSAWPSSQDSTFPESPESPDILTSSHP